MHFGDSTFKASKNRRERDLYTQQVWGYMLELVKEGGLIVHRHQLRVGRYIINVHNKNNRKMFPCHSISIIMIMIIMLVPPFFASLTKRKKCRHHMDIRDTGTY